MEFSINIIDSFPSLNKFAQKNNIILELNNKEYNLKKLITQQEIISIKENPFQICLKIFALSNNKKILIGKNQLNSEIFHSDKKSSIIWLEFKKKMEENKKEINDINLLFYDCIRLKIKISSNKIPSKSDKKIKTSKSKIKFGSPNEPRKCSQKTYNNDIKDNISVIKSCRIVNSNKNNLFKSQTFKETFKTGNVGRNTNDSSNINTNELQTKVLINEKLSNFEIDSQKSISHEYMKDLVLENDCLLTDNNIFDNRSLSNSQRDDDNNNNNNKKNVSEFKKREIKINNITDIKRNNNNINYEAYPQNSLIYPNNFNKMIKNILQSEEEKKNNNIVKRDASFNNNKKIDLKDESFNNNNSNTIRKLTMQHKKNKSFNKVIYNNNNNNIKATKKSNNNKLKIKGTQINSNISMSKENIVKECYTLNDFYNCKKIRNSFNENKEIDKNKELNKKENKILNDNKINNKANLSELLLSKMKGSTAKNEIIEEDEVSKDINEDEKIKSDEFSSMKKDYDLFYTLKFIRSIKNDLIDLEFNLAIDKSLSLFNLYNEEINKLYKRKKSLTNIIINYSNKIRNMHKKIYILDNTKKKHELKTKNKQIFKECHFDFNKTKLSQKKIFENLVQEKTDKKEKLKSIITSLMKKHTPLFDMININKNKKIEIENNNIKQVICKSPSKRMYNSPNCNDNTYKKKESNEIFYERKNTGHKNSMLGNNNKNNNNNDKKGLKKKNKSVKNNNLVVKTILNKNLLKNNSINNLLSYENVNKRNIACNDKILSKDNKSGDITNIHIVHKNNGSGKNNKSIYYSTARTNFYSFHSGKNK